MLAFPDPNTFEILPWRGDDAPVARMFCDIQPPLGGAVRRRSRATCCKRNLERAREKGFTFYVAPEMEFFSSSRTRRPSRSTTPASSTSPSSTW